MRMRAEVATRDNRLYNLCGCRATARPCQGFRSPSNQRQCGLTSDMFFNLQTHTSEMNHNTGTRLWLVFEVASVCLKLGKKLKKSSVLQRFSFKQCLCQEQNLEMELLSCRAVRTQKTCVRGCTSSIQA